MTSDTSPPPRRFRPLRRLGALAQLAAIALVGVGILTTAATLVGTGIGLALVLGIGIVLMIGALYIAWAAAWLEHERAEGLYGHGIPRLQLRTSGEPGFRGFLRTLWLQCTDGAMWRGIGSFAIATVLGWIVIGAASAVITGVALAVSPLGDGTGGRLPLVGIPVADSGAVAGGIIAAIASLGILFGVSLLDDLLTRSILVPSREAVLAEAARTAGAQRAGAVRASEVERTRIERDLHDGVQPRLVSVGMTLGMAQQKIDSDPVAAKALIDEAHTSTKAAITELRQLARGIHASVLDDRGLDAALSALAARSHVPVALDIRLDERCSATSEAAVYFVIAESLTNAAKHARATEVRVVVRSRGDAASGRLIWGRVEDNGIGGARVLPGGGLDGIMNRVLAAGGTATLDSPVGGPTALEVTVPCAS
ncbi:sensor histidine kinase [Microbacterium oleivorans]|uniref:sensor histidine kinase n=1 Tax=Microbacterium oleivorans TaxID=273677 RepID=UPI0010A4B716|nr:histidine kinase [Microbacterium oleivorans]THE07001.1 sensor histidine kinase [Microbacterium oleivorans]